MSDNRKERQVKDWMVDDTGKAWIQAPCKVEDLLE